MWLVISLSVVVGLVVGRGIVAETAAHLRGLPDNWWRPECDTCGSSLSLTMTHCRRSHHRQPWHSAGIPLVNATVFGVMAASVPTGAVLPAYLVFAATMVTLTVTDLQTKLIPNRILAPATIAGVALLAAGGLVTREFAAIGHAAIGGLAYFAALFLLALIGRGALGFGDVKMSFIIGVFTGYLSLGSVIIAGVGAFIIAGIVSVVLLVTRRSGRKDSIPFGPFMTTAGIMAIVYGPAIAEWYVA
jgi:prepilin signal peptidase PulO-like enzyme (type II secretory pathway)